MARVVSADEAPIMLANGYVTMYSLIQEGGELYEMLTSHSQVEKKAAVMIIRGVFRAVMATFEHEGESLMSCFSTVDDILLAPSRDGYDVVIVDRHSTGLYRKLYNIKGKYQAPFALATSFLSIASQSVLSPLCLNVAHFLSVATMYDSGEWRISVDSTMHEAPVSSGCSCENAVKILDERIACPSSIRLCSPPNERERSRDVITSAEAEALLEAIEGEDTWAPNVKAQARRSVALAACGSKGGGDKSTVADLIPDMHDVWNQKELVKSLTRRLSDSGKHTPPPFAPRTPSHVLGSFPIKMTNSATFR